MKRIKKYFEKTLNQRYGIIFGLAIGIAIMASVSYGINSIQSSSVSYTKDGNTMSVKQAIDDLIVKVNKKGGNFDIELEERTIGLNYTEETTDYENTIDSMLEKVISAVSNVATTEDLKVLKDSTLTWKSEDENVVSISGTTVTGKSVGSTTLLGTGSNGKQIKIPIKVISAIYLADVVAVGDYVAYDAGVWTSSANRPTSQGQFGGYTKGLNKANTVDWCFESYSTSVLKGWRVLKVDINTKTVTLVHAGIPECYYHSSPISGNTSVGNLNNRANSQYLNSSYAKSAHMMNLSEAVAITGSESGTTNDLRYLGPRGTTGNSAHYWLATIVDTDKLPDHLWYSYQPAAVLGNGNGANQTLGVRPVVVLKSNILTTGKGKDYVGQEAWTIVKP